MGNRRLYLQVRSSAIEKEEGDCSVLDGVLLVDLRVMRHCC